VNQLDTQESKNWILRLLVTEVQKHTA
jgi:hypothetical protein